MAQVVLLRTDNSTVAVAGLVARTDQGLSTELDPLVLAESTVVVLAVKPPIYITEIEQYTEIHPVAAQSELSGAMEEHFRPLTHKILYQQDNNHLPHQELTLGQCPQKFTAFALYALAVAAKADKIVLGGHTVVAVAG
jgi:hypothetical protein